MKLIELANGRFINADEISFMYVEEKDFSVRVTLKATADNSPLLSHIIAKYNRPEHCYNRLHDLIRSVNNEN